LEARTRTGQGRKVLISQRAEDDLARIYGYLAARNPDVAERFKTEAENALALLGKTWRKFVRAW